MKHRAAIVDPRRFEVDRELSRLFEIEDGAFTAVRAYPAKTMQEAGAKAEVEKASKQMIELFNDALNKACEFEKNVMLARKASTAES